MQHARSIVSVLLTALLIAVSAPVPAFSVEAAPPSSADGNLPGDAVARLKGEIDAIVIRELLPFTTAGIQVVSLKTGDIIYEFNPRLLLVPASTQKLFTAAAALSLLGPGREVVTTVALDAAEGTVYLKGCGDSLLSERDLVALAAASASKMDRGREYFLSADLSCFDGLYRGRGWMWDDDEFLISPLSVNQNGVTLKVRPGRKEGAPAVVTSEPATSYYRVENLARTGSGRAANSIAAYRRPGDRDNVVTLSGVIALGSAPVVKRASIWRPELMALTLFRDALEAQGVKVRIAESAIAPVPASATELARLSRRLEDLVRFALKTSDNPTAESLYKLMGMDAFGKPGTGEGGSAAVRRYLRAQGIDAENLVVADGSGLSRYNLTSAEIMTRTLRAMYGDRELYRIFRGSLPSAGEDGTLKNRLKGSCAEGNLRGKTGNMSGISSLAGYIDAADGEPLAFSVIIEKYAGSGRRAREIQDRIAKLLCGFRRAP